MEPPHLMSGRRREPATTAMGSGVSRCSSRRGREPESNFGPHFGRPDEEIFDSSWGAKRLQNERGLRDKLRGIAAFWTLMVLLTCMFVLIFGLSGWAVLATGALIASLLAVGASPVGAEEENADHKAATSACVGDALGDQMYTDVSDMHVFKDAINCVGYYGITNGTGDGSTFSPNDDVTRAEMAVFLARAAEKAGVDLGDAMDAGFSDIGDTWGEAQDAINQLTGKGILPEGDSYRPNDGMTRAEMAIALIGLLDATGAVEINDDGSITIGDDGSADDWFADARALSPAAVDRASAALFELGVANGSGRAAVVDDSKSPLDTNFDPNSTVSRGEMAAFITRALAHTSARPEGVTAQHDGEGVVIVSVRDENFAPVANAWVEVFYVESADEDDAFNSDDECGPLVEDTGNGDFVCEIDGADLLTDHDGDAETQAIEVPEDGVVAWAWTGELDDEVDDSTTLFRLAIDQAAAPAERSTTAVISTEFASSRAKMGSSVPYSMQLQNADGDDVTGGGLDAKEPAKWLVVMRTYRGSFDTTTALDTAISGGVEPVLVSTVPVTSKSDGVGSFTLNPLPDPRPDDKGDNWTVEYEVDVNPQDCEAGDWDGDTTDPENPDVEWRCSAPSADGGTVSETAPVFPTAIVVDGDAADSRRGVVVFSDLSGDAETISIETSSYVAVPSRAGRTALNRATVTVKDQFGDPVPDVLVTLTSSEGGTNGNSSLVVTPGNPAAEDANNGREFTTDSNGSYTFGYTWSSRYGAIETLTARTSAITDDPATTGDDEIENQATKMVRWAQDADEVQTNVPIVDGDVDANQIIVVVDGYDHDGDTTTATVDDVPLVLTYDDDDRFWTSPADPDANPPVLGTVSQADPASMAAFEKMLAGYLETDAVDGFVSWSNYDSGPRNTSVFTVHASS